MQELTPEERDAKLAKAKEMMERKKVEVFGERKSEYEYIVINKDLVLDDKDLFNGEYNYDKKYLLKNNDKSLYSRIVKVKGCVLVGENCDVKFTSLEGIGDIMAEGSKIKLPKLKTIEGNADFGKAQIIELPELQIISGYVDFNYSEIQSLPKLQTISKSASFRGHAIQSLPELKTIGENIDCVDCAIQNLPKLQTIGKSASFTKCAIQSLPKLKTIGENAYFLYALTKEMPELQTIGGSAQFFGSAIQSLPKLQTIGEDANFSRTKIKELPMLEKVGKRLYLSFDNIPLMPKLKSVDIIVIESVKRKDFVLTLKEFRVLEKDIRKGKTYDELKVLYDKIVKEREEAVLNR